MIKDRFKFRAWDPVKKEYYDEFYLMSNGDGVIYSPVEEDGNEDRLLIEQCTGLKDVNGNLIFEGDLLMDPDCFETTIVGDVRREEDGSYYCGDYGAYEFGTLEIWGTVNEHPECVE